MVLWFFFFFYCETPAPLAECNSISYPEPGVFCSAVLPGSPAQTFDFQEETWLTHINECEISSLDDLLDSVRRCDMERTQLLERVNFDEFGQDEPFLAVRSLDCDGRPHMNSFQQDSIF